MAIMHGMGLPKPRIFVCAGTERLALNPCLIPFAEDKALSTQGTPSPCTCHDCNFWATGMPLSRPAVVQWRRQGLAGRCPLSKYSRSLSCLIRPGSGPVERERERKEQARIAAAHASGGRWAQTIQRVAARRRARRSAARGKRRDDDEQGHDARARGAARARRDVSGRHGPESPRLGVLGGAGQWAPHVGHAARAHSLARRPPAAGRQRGVRSGGAPLAATRLPARPPTATTWRPRQRDRRHRRTRCLVSPLARPPSFGRGALLARVRTDQYDTILNKQSVIITELTHACRRACHVLSHI